MAEWMEVMNQFNRMCWHYQRKRECPMGCPMNGLNISQRRKVAFEQPEVTEKTVMDWAEEHPELIYPSIAKYLERFGIMIRRDGSVEADFFRANEPMSAEMAKLLGISPGEGENEKTD